MTNPWPIGGPASVVYERNKHASDEFILSIRWTPAQFHAYFSEKYAHTGVPKDLELALSFLEAP